jgi:hypothetical protein
MFRFDVSENEGADKMIGQLQVVNQEEGRGITCSFVDNSNPQGEFSS